MDAPGGRLQRRMNREGNSEVLRGGEDRIVIDMAVRLARDRERADEGALAAVLDRALEFACGRRRIAERDVRDRNQPSAGIAAEVCNPAIVRAAIGVREIRVENLRLPQQPDRRIQHRLRHALGFQQREPLLHIHGSVRRPRDVGIDRLDAFEAVEHPMFLARSRLQQLAPRRVHIFDLRAEFLQLLHAAERGEQGRAGEGGASCCRIRDIRACRRRF